MSVERRRNERAGKMGDPREDLLTNSIVRHDSYTRKSESSSEGGAQVSLSPPPTPVSLICLRVRRCEGGVTQANGELDVKVMLRVSGPLSGAGALAFLSVDARRKQVTLVDPSVPAASEDRRLGVAAPKMFAFDAVFTRDESQSACHTPRRTGVTPGFSNLGIVPDDATDRRRVGNLTYLGDAEGVIPPPPPASRGRRRSTPKNHIQVTHCAAIFPPGPEFVTASVRVGRRGRQWNHPSSSTFPLSSSHSQQLTRGHKVTTPGASPLTSPASFLRVPLRAEWFRDAPRQVDGSTQFTGRLMATTDNRLTDGRLADATDGCETNFKWPPDLELFSSFEADKRNK
ncbi:hypothetical protein PR048_000791 [Dryococelus australis]|uniref:Uncharacterized protein n=1 Tax=Dryococelus australis TaxID=614101 RepID=A0ABQ9IFK9_9NEOP|nr:hypothetical protein PR048_000791 [Dryococelus australis]